MEGDEDGKLKAAEVEAVRLVVWCSIHGHYRTMSPVVLVWYLCLSLSLSPPSLLPPSLTHSLTHSLSLSPLSLSLSLCAGCFFLGCGGGNSSSESCKEAVLLGLQEDDWQRIRQVHRLRGGLWFSELRLVVSFAVIAMILSLLPQFWYVHCLLQYN